VAPAILVVDDDPAIRLLCRINLELEGYEAVEAASLAEARALAASRELGGVLLDLRVGFERSEEFLAELRGREPPVPVALLTGAVEAHGGDEVPVLGKPFTIEQLLSTVRGFTG
jgi:two-component system KDP operon response regulator KdpE